MIFSYDAYKRLDRPYVYLAKPNKDYIGTIQARELNTDLCFNDISTVTFKVNKYEDGEETLHYKDIASLKLIEITYIGWFQITEIKQESDGNNEYIDVVALSLENESTSKLLTSFGQLGVETDEQGGLDRYCLYDIADKTHSILHIWLDKMPAWNIGYVDPSIIKEYRTFTDDEVSAYNFLTGTVSETFECIFQFDSFTQTVSAYKLENIGVNTSIYLSHENLIKKKILSSNFYDIKTVFTVAGGDDNGTPLGIIEVNPTGNNKITNFSFYKKDMSESLRNKLDLYEVEYNNRLEGFTNATDVLKALYDELGQLKTKIPSDVNSIDWALYGLDELNVKYNYYNERMAVYIGKTDPTSLSNYSSNYVLREAVNSQLTIRKAEVAAKELAIENQRLLCESLTLNLRDYLGESLFKELSRFYHEDTFTDDTFIVTESMSEAEALEMKRELLKMAQDKLAKVCKPSYTLDIDAINFTAIPEFIKYSEQLELGNIMTLDFGDDILVESRLLKMHINWDKLDDFSLTFSSKNRLDGFDYEFAEIANQASSSSTSQHLNGTGWNNAKNKTSTFDEYMKSTLDLANQKLKNSENEEFTADSTGTKWKKWLPDQNKYSPNQMWGTGNGLFLTQTNWQSVSMAIGEGAYNGATVYGVWADVIVGNFILSKNLHIINANSSIIMNENGATFTNCDITINKGTSTLKLNATDGIKLTNNGVNQFYIDGSGNATFVGLIKGGSININNKFIVDSSGNLTANNATLNNGTFSGTLSGATGTFSGNLSAAGGTFTGTLQGVNGTFSGSITASTITGGTITGTTITGATLNTNNGAFSVDSNGTLHANTATFGSGSTTMSIDNNGFKTYQNGVQKSNLYINGLVTEVVAANIIQVIVSGSAKDVIHTGNISSYTSGFAPASHYHGTLYSNSSSSGYTAYISSSANFVCPNNGDLGTSSNPWISVRANNVYNSAGLITSSDERKKNTIELLDNRYDMLFEKLKPVSYKYNNGTSGRTHLGLIAQEVEQAMNEVGLTDKDCAILVKDPVYSKMNDDGSYDELSGIVDYDYSIRYNELIPLLISKIKDLQLKVDKL